MSTATLHGPALRSAHASFVESLPRVNRELAFRLRGLPPHERSEALADGRAAAWSAWRGLALRGKDPVEVGVTGIAKNSASYVLRGRRLGCGTLGRRADLLDRRAQRRHNLRVLSLDRDVDDGSNDRTGSWQNWLVADHRMTPADMVAFALDFQEWLARLPAKKRRVAVLLADGETTSGTARLLKITPGRVAQYRTWLEQSWNAFQADELDSGSGLPIA
jgi:hypothetical protein